MRIFMRIVGVSTVVGAVCALGLSGCNTVEGAGKDVKSVGKAIEEEADEHH